MSGRGFTVPPGRAGRIWLRRRLEVARRGAELLDRKLRVIRGELDRLHDAEAAAIAAWDQASADAERWLLRASLLGGQRAIRVAADGRLADVTVSYGTVMGVRYPSSTSCVIPEARTWDTPVIAAARQAHAAALAAAARAAAAAEAVRLAEAEARATGYRLRAVKDRWIPRLEQALTEVTLAIEEQEITDAARLRLATRAGAGGGAGARLRGDRRKGAAHACRCGLL